MSRHAINLLIDSGLITASGKPTEISELSDKELSARVSQYVSARIETIETEIESRQSSQLLNALFSSESTESSIEKLLPSALVYQSIIIDDPLISAQKNISYDTIKSGLNLFATYFRLIQADMVTILPLSFINKPSDEVPLLVSDDAFRSSIPANLHDYIHSNACLKSVLRDETGRILILNERAAINRRPALNVSFKDDFWKKGVQLYLFQTLEKSENADGSIEYKRRWDQSTSLSESQFKRWAYQTINQAMRVRLGNIYNETRLASKLNHTYVTESKFESKLLNFSGIGDTPPLISPCRFLEANRAFISISSPEMVLELREKYSSAFERFNSSLLYASEHLNEVEQHKYEIKAQQYFQNEILPQIDELRGHARAITRSATKGALISLGGITTAMLSGSYLPLIPSLMITAATSASEALESTGRYQDFKKSPVYIWHRIAKYRK